MKLGMVSCHGTNMLWHVPPQNHEPSWEKLRFARSLYQNLFLFGQFFYHSMVVPWHDTHAKFHDFQTCFGFTRILKPSFSMFSAEPRCPDVWILFSFLACDLEISRGHKCDFSTNFGAREHVLVVQIWLMHIKWPETQLMYKKRQTYSE